MSKQDQLKAAEAALDNIDHAQDEEGRMEAADRAIEKMAKLSPKEQQELLVLEVRRFLARQ